MDRHKGREETGEEATPEGPRYSVPALEKTLDIIEYLSAEPQPRTRSEIARALGRGPSELFRMLTCLESRGYVRRDVVSGAYALTLRLFELAHMHTPFDTLFQVGRPLMQELVLQTGESCHLSVIQGDALVVVMQEECRKPFRLSVEVGGRHPPHRTTSGRIILSQMATQERDRLLSRLEDFESLKPAQRQEFIQRLETIRREGFHITEDEWLRGELVIGVPIGGAGLQTRAALVIPTLAGRDQKPILELLPALRACAEQINRIAGLSDLATEKP